MKLNYSKKIIFRLIGIFFLIFLLGYILRKDNQNTVLESSQIAYFYVDESGKKTSLETIPKDKNYTVNVSCDQDVLASWNYTNWSLKVRGLKEKTHCNITFSPPKYLEDIVREKIVTTGQGVYEISHEGEVITAPLSEEQRNHLLQKEYRYAGENPNNYVLFNDELWRIVGILNTPEGYRVKLIRKESLGIYSWNTSDTTINNGAGINEWSVSDVMHFLNPGYESNSIGGSLYWNSMNGRCYSYDKNNYIPCNFQGIGLKCDAKNRIDTVTWNIGSNGDNGFTNASNGLPKHFYQYERSNYTGKNCGEGPTCNDTVSRTVLWVGKVGLMHPSDYGYATSGGSSLSRDKCMQVSSYQWEELGSDCYLNDWLFDSTAYQWTMNPRAYFVDAFLVFFIRNSGYLSSNNSSVGGHIRPVVYLKENQRVIEGSGTIDNPYLFL